MCLHFVAMMANVPHGLIIFLCSSVVDGLIDKVNILHEFITFDHKRVIVTFRGMKGSLQAPTIPQQGSIPIMDWSKADAHCINSYQTGNNAQLPSILHTTVLKKILENLLPVGLLVHTNLFIPSCFSS